MTCNCIEEKNTQLTSSIDADKYPEGIAKIETAFCFIDSNNGIDMIHTPSLRINIEYKNRKGNRSNKKLEAGCIYCPFCGNKYKEDGEKNV